MELFKDARSVRLRSHLGTYLCALDGVAVSHGHRRNSRGTVWAVELAGDDYVRLQGHRGLYLGATELPADVLGRGRGTRACCGVVLGSPSCPNDNAFLWSPLREGEHLALSGPYGRLLRARFGHTAQDNAVTVDLDADPEESSWVVEVVPAAEAALLLPPSPRPCRAQSCNARLEADTSESDTASSVLARVRSAKDMTSSLATVEEEPLSMPAARLIFYNTARDDGGVDEFDEGTWKYFSFKEQSLAALHRRLEEETRRHDFVVCRRSGPGLFPVVLDLPPGSSQMEFVLVPAPSPAVADVLENDME
ncbi:uncharacterized protein [Aegilops tauschii subsp. strangulata]|uniref:uncharacterized protein n=1 Tax=Aegilops tauschii subsp. strangulata TaxID=200361 RepID=UPI00098BC429|nr:uncharacterized protein LOC109768206 [Aegilops tauschii subsp. strangulata]